MLKILQRYVLKEVLIPTVMAMGILTFLVMARMAFSESKDVGGNLSLSLTMQLLVSILPTLMTITVPISLLIGVLLGIGRLTVDSEIKAFRTHGVNLFPVFLPVLGLGVFASLLLLYNGLFFAPAMMARSFALLDDLIAEEIQSLEPGKFHNLPGMMGTDAVLYFKEKNPETGELKNIYLSIEGGAQPMGIDLNAVDQEVPSLSEGLKTIAAPPSLDGKGVTPQTGEAEPKTTGGAAKENWESFGDSLMVDAAPEPTTTTQQIEKAQPPLTSTLVLSSLGRIQFDLATKRASLSLTSGTIHFISTRDDPKYMIMDFDHAEPEIKGYAEIGLSRHVDKREWAWSFTEMNQQVNKRLAALEAAGPVKTPKGEKPPKALQEIRYIRARQYARVSLSLACFAFVLIGLPLAIYIRPSGKSVGVSIAFLLVMAYYAFYYFGEHLIRIGASFWGPVVIFTPIVLLSAIGGVLLLRVVHR